MDFQHGAGVIAQGEFLPDIFKQAGSDASAVAFVEDADGCQILRRRVFHAVAQSESQHQFALLKIQGLLHIAGLRLHGIEPHVGAQIQIQLLPGQGGQGLQHQQFHAVGTAGAAVEDLHRGLRQDPVVMLGQILVADGIHRLLRAETHGGVVFETAHLLHAPGEGIAALVVDAAADDVLHLFLFAVHHVGKEQSAPGLGTQEHLSHEVRDQGEDILALRQIPGVGEAGIQSRALDLAYAAHHGHDLRSVQFLQPHGDGFHIRALSRAPPQHVGDQRVLRRVLRTQLGQQGDAEAVGLEPVALHDGEHDTGYDLFSDRSAHLDGLHPLSLLFTVSSTKSFPIILS